MTRVLSAGYKACSTLGCGISMSASKRFAVRDTFQCSDSYTFIVELSYFSKTDCPTSIRVRAVFLVIVLMENFTEP
jgi:hypothetical protein